MFEELKIGLVLVDPECSKSGILNGKLCYPDTPIAFRAN
jgi:hypothetical protein